MMNATHIALRVPGLQARLERRLQGLPEQIPLLVVSGEGSRALVLSACPRALAQGVRPGMRLGNVEGYRGEVIHASPPRYEAGERDLAHLLSGELPDVAPLRAGWFAARWSRGRRFLAIALQRADALLRAEGHAGAWGVAAGDASAEIAAAVAPVGEMIMVAAEETAEFLSTQPVRLLADLSPQHVAVLREIGVQRFGQLAALPAEVLRSLFGPDGPRLRRVALRGERGPAPEQWRGQHEFGGDTAELDEVRRALADLVADGLAHCLRGAGRQPRRMLLTVIYSDGRRTTTRLASPRPEHEGSWQRLAAEQLERTWTRRVRLSELRLSVEWGAPPSDQLALFVPDGLQFRDRRLTHAVSQVRDRWGRGGVRFAAAG